MIIVSNRLNVFIFLFERVMLPVFLRKIKVIKVLWNLICLLNR